MSRRRWRRLLLALLVLVLIIVILGGLGYGMARLQFPQTEGEIRLDGLQAPVEVYRDSWGIPHLYAANPHDLFFAQGFVHAQDRFWQMEFQRRIGSGRLSEVLGPSALSSDRFIRTVGWHRTAAAELEMLDAETRSMLEAYAEGVNAYLSTTSQSRLGLEFVMLRLIGTEVTIEPWTPLNTMTWTKIMAWDLSGNMDSELLRARIVARLGTPALAELMPPYADDMPVIVPHPLTAASLEAIPQTALDVGVFGRGSDIGSNSWVVAGSRTATGMPLLANDPHLGIQMPSIWYEIGLHCETVDTDCPYDVVGSSFPGSPGVVLGHNAHIAWGATNLAPDVQDLFVERINPDNPNQYEVDGEWVDMEIVREEIRVAGEDEPVVVFARITRHGPIINDVVGGEEEEWMYGWEPLALSWTALEPGTVVRAIGLLDRAQNWDDFQEALSYWDVPSQNFVYADVEGNIGYQTPGRIPIRARGDGTMPVPGWGSDYEWTGTIPYDALPRAFNPEEGYIVTANNAVVGPEFPYFLSADWNPGFRAERIVELIEADDSLTVPEMQAIQGDSTPTWARRVLPYVVALSSEEPRLVEAIELLRAWDGRAHRDSAAAALFESFHLHLAARTFEDELGESLFGRVETRAMASLPDLLANPASLWFDDVDTAEVREQRDDVLLLGLSDAVEELTEHLGRNMAGWRWGDLHTATFENASLGQSGIRPVEMLFNRGPAEADGALHTVNNTAYSPGEPYAVAAVPSYRQIIDLQDLTRSVSMHTTGQSGHPFHPHYDDMIDPWRNVQYHRMLWTRSEVTAAAAARLTLTP
jgi:penicillin amidase